MKILGTEGVFNPEPVRVPVNNLNCGLFLDSLKIANSGDRPAWSKKLAQQTFENNSDRFRTNLDPFTGVFGLPSGNNNES